MIGVICTNAASGTASPGNVLVLYTENDGTVQADGIKAGGIVGYISQTAVGGRVDVAYCANRGSVTSAKGRTGGIVGFVYAQSAAESRMPSLRFCINTGTVTAGVGYESAGVLGLNAGIRMDNCVNLGALVANDSAAGGRPVGGVVGKTYPMTSLVYTITACYTTQGDVIPAAAHEKPAQFVFTNCAAATEAVLVSGETALTYGADGYTVRGGRLLLTAFAPALVKGDVNGDGKVDLADALVAIHSVINADASTELAVADLNGDGEISLADVLLILRLITA